MGQGSSNKKQTAGITALAYNAGLTSAPPELTAHPDDERKVGITAAGGEGYRDVKGSVAD